MPIDRPTAFIVVHEDGSYTGLTKTTAPDEAHAGRAEAVLYSQGRRGYLIKLEGSPGLSPEITQLRAMNSPGLDFETVKAIFIKKNSALARRMGR